MFRDRDPFVAACDIVDKSAELRLRLGQRQRLHNLTSLQTNCRMRRGTWGRVPLHREGLEQLVVSRITNVLALLLGGRPFCNELQGQKEAARRIRRAA